MLANDALKNASAWRAREFTDRAASVRSIAEGDAGVALILDAECSLGATHADVFQMHVADVASLIAG